MRLALTFAGLVLALSLAPAARGQGPAAKLDVVVSASGEVVSPWVPRELCQKSTGRCQKALMNPETGEVARMGGVLGTDFELTGYGHEIRRAETAMAKAVKQKAEQ